LTKGHKINPKTLRRDKLGKNADIYTFQEKLPKFKVVTTPKDFNESPVRPAIMKILSEGILDEDVPKDNTRFALTAKEIKQKLDNNENTKVKKTSYTNLYFHLNKMVEVGVIQPIAQVIERSHRITYYGRSAHVVLLGSPETEIKQITKAFTELFTLMKIINTKFPEIQVEELAEHYVQQNHKRNTNYARWIAQNIEIINENSLDVSKIFKALKFGNVRNSEMNRIFDEYFPFNSD
jgi:hypothetical protein